MRRWAVATLAAAALTVAAPATPKAYEPCHPAQLHPRLFLQGATGSLLGGVTVTNISHTTCSLAGTPSLSLSPGTVRDRLVGRLPGKPALKGVAALRAGTKAMLWLQWRNWCGQTRPRLVVQLPQSGGSFHLQTTHTPRCDAPTSPSLVTLTRFGR